MLRQELAGHCCPPPPTPSPVALCKQGRQEEEEEEEEEQGQLPREHLQEAVRGRQRGARPGPSHDAEAWPRSRLQPLEPRRRAPVEPPQLDAVLTIDPGQAGAS